MNTIKDIVRRIKNGFEGDAEFTYDNIVIPIYCSSSGVMFAGCHLKINEYNAYIKSLLYGTNSEYVKTLPGYREKGYGSWLLSILIEFSREFGCKTVGLQDASEKTIGTQRWLFSLYLLVNRGIGFYMGRGFLTNNYSYKDALEDTNEFLKSTNLVLDNQNEFKSFVLCLKKKLYNLRNEKKINTLKIKKLEKEEEKYKQ